MDSNIFRSREIVFLKHVRFPDDNSIDVRMNGRPFLVYKVDKGNVYLLKVSSSNFMPDYCYHPLILSPKRNKKKKVSYVDLRYLIKFDEEELDKKIISEFDYKFRNKPSSKRELISVKDYNLIKEKMEELAKIKALQACTSCMNSIN